MPAGSNLRGGTSSAVTVPMLTVSVARKRGQLSIAWYTTYENSHINPCRHIAERLLRHDG